MLVDDVTIRVRGGAGGRGAVAFQGVKMALGPTGGSGGHGGSVYIEGVSDLGALSGFRYKKEFVAESGEGGRKQFVDGKRGDELILKVPVGTIVYNLETSVAREIVKVGERLLVAKGGHGGRGNFHFRSSTNTSPKELEEGEAGESARIRLELRLIADVGLVGLPNAGKTSLLNAVTNAGGKVANYPFTTLEPNLGTYYDLILADVPGLIEGAGEGKGLGHKFLRHVARTRVLFHLVSAESEEPKRDYDIVRRELASFSNELAAKKEYVFLTKTDIGSGNLRGAIPINLNELKRVKEILNEIAKEKHI